MIRFAYPWALLLPALLILALLLRRKKTEPLLFPSKTLTAGVPASLRVRLRRPVLGLLSLAFVACLTMAAARPQHVTTFKEKREARNLMLALDVSGSMQARDFGGTLGILSRLEAVKIVVREFVKARPDDRIGLVVFGLKAFLESPLTFDHELIQKQVDNLQVGIAGDGTAIGEGLGLSLKRIEEIEGDSRAVILMTDGVDNVKTINPIQAAKVAKDLGIKVHTIGIGPSGTGFSFDFFNRIPFDSEVLEEVADISGGVYFNANSIDGLKRVYAEIDKLETTEEEEPSREIVEELFAQYAWWALLAYLTYTILVHSVFMKLP